MIKRRWWIEWCNKHHQIEANSQTTHANSHNANAYQAFLLLSKSIRPVNGHWDHIWNFWRHEHRNIFFFTLSIAFECIQIRNCGLYIRICIAVIFRSLVPLTQQPQPLICYEFGTLRFQTTASDPQRPQLRYSNLNEQGLVRQMDHYINALNFDVFISVFPNRLEPWLNANKRDGYHFSKQSRQDS